MRKYVIDLDKDIKKESKTTTKIYAFDCRNGQSKTGGIKMNKFPEHYRKYLQIRMTLQIMVDWS